MDSAAPPVPIVQRHVDSPSFWVDHMLIRLGRWLRLCGYDTVWNTALNTRELIRRANAEERIFVTCNTHIPHNFPKPHAWLRLRSTSPIAQFHELVTQLGLNPSIWAFSRCVMCNVRLIAAPSSKDNIVALPRRVRARQPLLWQCKNCGRLYWRGSHVERTCQLLGLSLR